jgi:hypothetical protein
LLLNRPGATSDVGLNDIAARDTPPASNKAWIVFIV